MGMTENWKQWEGRMLDGKLPLTQYLGGSDHSAVFLTERAEAEPRRVAVKIIPAKNETADLQLERWERTADLSHPHLLRIFQWGRCELDSVPLLYVVMEYAEENLGQIFPLRPLTAEESREMLLPTLDALTYLHARGFVHGGIRPSNVLAVSDQLKLSSDGIVKARDPGPGLGAASPYASPEAASGSILPAGDVWSLAVVLVQGLTQRLPASGASPQGDPVVPPTIPTPFFDIARNCLRTDPQKRWTPTDIAARLRSTSATPTMNEASALPQATLANWRYGVAIAVAVVVLAIFVSWRIHQPGPAVQESPSVSGEVTSVQPAPEQRSEKPNAGQSARAEKKPGPPASSPAPPPSQPATAPSAGNPASGVVHQVLPRVPQSARNTIQGKVRVRVRVSVDPAGNVTGTTLDSAGPSKYFAKLATEAAQQWKFAPAQINGRNVASTWVIRFAFGRTATEVYPVRSAPPH
jgi:TonB family protein